MRHQKGEGGTLSLLYTIYYSSICFKYSILKRVSRCQVLKLFE